MNESSVLTHSVKGQYGPGAVKGQIVVGYDDELGRDSDTETLVAIKVFVDNWRWKGVPFYIRTGQRLLNRQSAILIQFKNVKHFIFAPKGKGLEPTPLLIRLHHEEK